MHLQTSFTMSLLAFSYIPLCTVLSERDIKLSQVQYVKQKNTFFIIISVGSVIGKKENNVRFDEEKENHIT